MYQLQISFMFIKWVSCEIHTSPPTVTHKLFIFLLLYDRVVLLGGDVLIKKNSRFQSGIEISRAKCFCLPQRQMLPLKRDNRQWHEKEMRYWYSYETNVSKHATSSAQQDEILNVRLPFTVIIELLLRETVERETQLKPLKDPTSHTLISAVYTTSEVCKHNTFFTCFSPFITNQIDFHHLTSEAISGGLGVDRIEGIR